MKFTQLPGTLGVEIVVGDEVSMSVDFDRDITGYQLEAPIYVARAFASSIGGISSSVAAGDIVTNWTISVTNAANGTIALGLTEAQTAILATTASYRWFLRWVDPSGYTRTVLSGEMKTRNP